MPRPLDSTTTVVAGARDGAASTAEGTVDLYWIPLGAGGHSVRFNGVVYEAVSAAIQRRRRFDIYHCALQIRAASGLYAVEMTPVPNDRGWERGVVVHGAVGTRWAGRFRIFRYEVRRWRDGVVPDLQYAVGGPIRLSDDAVVAGRVLEQLAFVPALTWGRDESDVGEMWSCNSIISWVLTRAGVNTEGISLPARGRAPGWNAGIAIATRQIYAVPIAPTDSLGRDLGIHGVAQPTVRRRHPPQYTSLSIGFSCPPVDTARSRLVTTVDSPDTGDRGRQAGRPARAVTFAAPG